MTKAEYIERYGLERYEEYKKRKNERRNQRYRDDPEYRKSMKVRSNAYGKARYWNDPEYREYKRVQTNNICKERYQTDSEYRETRNIRTKVINRNRYCNYIEDGRIDLVENYELALVDNFKDWDIHHRLELHPDCSIRFTMKSLIKLELYYDRPPAELIWLRHSEHMRMHGKARRSN